MNLITKLSTSLERSVYGMLMIPDSPYFGLETISQDSSKERTNLFLKSMNWLECEYQVMSQNTKTAVICKCEHFCGMGAECLSWTDRSKCKLHNNKNERNEDISSGNKGSKQLRQDRRSR